MPTIILQLEPRRLANPDLDIRYALPDRLIARSHGRLANGGYDYVGDGLGHRMLIFLQAADPDAALPDVLATLATERILGNDLSDTPVAIEADDNVRVVHPVDFTGTFVYREGR